MSEIKKEEVVLAAWLHDVGKFAQRADVKELYDKSLEIMYCKPTSYGGYSHQHVVYTEGFINAYKDIFPDEINILNVKNLASNHHNPSSYYDWIIAEADRLSNGSDRCNVLGEIDAKNEADFDESKTETKLKFYEKPMIHILSSMHLDKRENPKNAFCKMAELDGKNIIPVENYKLSKETYVKLWKKFVFDFEKLSGLEYDEFLLSLNSLLERYWWCIPSATNVDADISLYQHAKTTVAFAAALFEYQKEENAEDEVSLKTDGKKFLFINGDISGIQKYIFDLKTSSDNAKLLRAKSFQLWVLGEIISQYIVKKFGVTYADIMTSAGGKFIIFLPNTKKARKLLPEIQLEIEEYFLNEFAGKLACIISGGTEATYKDLEKGNVISLINRIGDDGDIAKSKKMQKVLAKRGAVLTAYYDDLQKNGECPKCGVFAASKTEGGDDERQCRTCTNLIEIGGKLVKSAKITLYSDVLKPFEKMIHFCKDDDNSKFYYSINDYKPGLPLMYLPYVAPKKENGELLNFKEIADNSKGNKKLAMFKSDVDNLGLIFSQSLGERMSFSRYADLSHMLHFFFSSFYAWFVNNKKDQNGDLYKDKIYTVFSGGDDLCVLGSWDSIMQFALDFEKELAAFTNNNPSVTLSGGIVLSSSNVPVRNIAEAAEENLEKSKGRPGKNAITVFGTTVSWNEYEKLLEDGKFLQSQLELNKKNPKDGVSTGVIYKFLDFANRAEKTLGNGKCKIADVSELVGKTDEANPKDRIWKSNFVYILARNVKDEKLKKWLLKFGENPNTMINSRVAVSYALYTQRKN